MERHPGGVLREVTADGHSEPVVPLDFTLDVEERATLREVARALSTRTDSESARALRSAALAVCGAQPSAKLVAATHLLVDLVQLDWQLERRGSALVAIRPAFDGDGEARRQRVRREELLAHQAQLRKRSVRSFVMSVERRRVKNREVVSSIFDLMRDGRGLAADLRRIAVAADDDVDVGRLADAVRPYVQMAPTGVRCEQTNLDLSDIWRYFRHTWANQAVSTPGRSMPFLVRDAAASYHPVIGIGALCSPVVQLSERDAWIGWDREAFMERAGAAPPAELSEWLDHIEANAFDELYIDDLLAEGVVAPSDLRQPSREAFVRLAEFARVEREKHHRNTHASELKVPTDDWESKAKTHLYRSKRALALADVLYMRVSQAAIAAQGVTTTLADRASRKGIVRALRKAKKDRVGISMADISVCGAVAPYNHLLGGKLVSMLACSPEVVEAYRSKYAQAQSEIASSMAARAIERRPDLVFLGTTSLYGVPLSQYTRVRVPPEVLSDPHGEGVRFRRLGRSKSYGTSQFSAETVNALVQLVEREHGGVRVNSLFGEGVNPKMRKIREGLDLLGAPSEGLLRHGRSRVVYGVKLAHNMSQYLLGFSDEPDYLFRVAGPESTARIAEYWLTRWVAPRLDKPGFLDRVARERKTYPIRHGARVDLPPSDDGQLSMFGDLE